VGAYLKREFALPVSGVAVIVYSLDAYAADTDVSDEEVSRVASFLETKEGDRYVIVAVLASSGPASPLSPRRFAANFEGNKVMQSRRDVITEAIEWGGPVDDTPAAHREYARSEMYAKQALRLIYADAAEVTDYDAKYCVVAD
jgi:hypothetical protein